MTIEMEDGNQFCKDHLAFLVIPTAQLGIITALRPPNNQHVTWGALCTKSLRMSAQLPDMDPERVPLHMRDGRKLRAGKRYKHVYDTGPYIVDEIRVNYPSLAYRLCMQD